MLNENEFYNEPAKKHIGFKDRETYEESRKKILFKKVEEIYGF